MTPEQMRQEAAQRAAHAVAEGIEQFRSGWTPAEVLTVLADAAGPVQDLRDQADAHERAQQIHDRAVSSSVRLFLFREKVRRAGS